MVRYFIFWFDVVGTWKFSSGVSTFWKKNSRIHFFHLNIIDWFKNQSIAFLIPIFTPNTWKYFPTLILERRIWHQIRDISIFIKNAIKNGKPINHFIQFYDRISHFTLSEGSIIFYNFRAKDGVLLEPSAKFVMETKRNGEVSLTVHDCTPEDAGNYQLNAQNPSGEITCDSRLSVKGKTGRLFKVDIHRKNCRFHYFTWFSIF